MTHLLSLVMANALKMEKIAPFLENAVTSVKQLSSVVNNIHNCSRH